MALTTVQEVKSWASPEMDSERDFELERCIDAAGRWILGTTRRVIEEAEHTLYYGGDYDHLARVAEWSTADDEEGETDE